VTKKLLTTVGVLCLCLVVAGRDPVRASGVRVELDDGTEAGVVESFDAGGVTYFRLSDVCRVTSCARHWNPRSGKMTVAVGGHRITLTPDNPFVAFDGAVRNLARPPLLRRGVLWVPPSFVTGPLAVACAARIHWSPDGGPITITTLGAAVTRVSLRERGDDTVVVFDLTGLSRFSLDSPDRSLVEVVMYGARLVDTLGIAAGGGLVSSVAVRETERGVRASIRVAGDAAAYDGELYHDPPRIEVRIKAAGGQGGPTPALSGIKPLGPGPAQVFGRVDDRIETVMIDPGHGGRDAGAVGPSGVEEKEVTLALARELSRALRGYGFYVFMTRSSDSYVPLHRRAEIANLAVADLFVSLQCDGWYSGAAEGFRVCYFQPASRREARATARGLPRLMSGARPAIVDEFTWDRIQEDFVDESRALARKIHAFTAEALEMRDRGVARATFRVLSGCAMPAVVVELGFITNRSDETLLTDGDFLRRAAEAIAKGVAEYRRSAREGEANG